jgi:hypothetical protein
MDQMDQMESQNPLRSFAEGLANQAKACRKSAGAMEAAVNLLKDVSDEQIIDAAHPSDGGESILTIARESIAASRAMADASRKIGQQVAALHARATAACDD